MNELYDILFKDYGFEAIRNKIFDNLISNIEGFFKKNEYNGPDDFLSKLKEFLKFNPNFIYENFKFKFLGDSAYFYHQKYNFDYNITTLKKYEISLNSDGNDAKEEWIFNYNYLMYLIFKVYNMKNPKITHSFDSINEESSVYSLNEGNIKYFMTDDWKTIYEAKDIIDISKILEIKTTTFDNKINKKFFIDLIGLKEINQLPKEFLEYKIYSSSFDDIFPLDENSNKKTVIFHNEDIYFRFNLFQQLEYYFQCGLYGNFYINFQLLRDCKRKERIERIAYFLSFLFPNDYSNFKTFFEERIKPKISDKLECWLSIINEIINYFIENIFIEKNADSKITASGQKNEKMDSKNNFYLFNKVNEKKFIFIFDNILKEEENNIVENIIKECSTSNFIFFIIYSLKNEFTSKQFIKYVNKPYDVFYPFSLYFANIKNFEAISPQYNEEIESKIFNKSNIDDEILVYDLIRIFNFRSIFVDSINSDGNYKSLGFLSKYIQYLNINFDNKNKKIINISFKNKNIEKEFKDMYDETMTQIKTKNEILFNNINGQRDGFDIEKIIISNIISKGKEGFNILEAKSIFGLKDLNKKEKVNYKISNFILTQKSSCGEMFDVACKIIKENKQYVKLGQITSIKTEEEKKKLSIEKIRINCSYLQKEFKEKELGEIDGISFCIIAPLRIRENNNKSYKDLKKFCRENNYEFILFDINKGSFFKRNNGKFFDIDFFEVDNQFLLNFENFSEIITIDKPLKILSVRKVKDRDEDKEDLDSNQIAKCYINNNIKRIAKFEFFGSLTDLKGLKENYFLYIYFQKKISIYYYKDRIVKIIKQKEDDKIDTKKYTLILYSTEIINDKYLDSSKEIDDDKNEIINTDENIEYKEEINEENKKSKSKELKKSKSVKKNKSLLGRKTKNKIENK